MTIVTDPEFWDCDCNGTAEKFVQSKALAECPACGTFRDDAPDSREVELTPTVRMRAKVRARNSQETSSRAFVAGMQYEEGLGRS